MLPDQRCEECGRPFRGEHPKRFDPSLCPTCAKADADEAQAMNIDPTTDRTGDYYTFKHHGERIPLFRK